MKSKFLLLAITIATLGSCSSAYRSGQTPDDVYYSPTRTINVDNRNHRNNNTQDEVSTEDRTIYRGIKDSRYRHLDTDYDYGYNPYNYGFSNGYYYNPRYYPYPVYNNTLHNNVYIKPTNTTPRKENLNSYNGKGYNTINANYTSTKPVKIRNNISNSDYSTTKSISTTNTTTRSYTPSNSSSTRSSSNSSSGSSVPRASRH